ncbi:HAD family hydrolase [Spirulina sp. CS-785/01]|uniref:HAD family hydrolase n=1 Tax=Spirulina sp. CS-785/01 TaxID=3021716 RepID=UPI0023310D9F|nr:HAD family hydrolase [Spirulina sp. CS-785/01]MDB9315992.1 HAD family hydrolase [Spirulina sp. CS-785/01]
MLNSPDLLALDFDGVVCDGLKEYFQTTCRVYRQLWPTDTRPLNSFEQRFYQLRPVIESGWEMPLLLRALVQGITDEQILKNWSALVQDQLKSEQLNPKTLAQQVDTVRDEWIKTNLEDWLALHQFYPPVLQVLQHLQEQETPKVVIITTKEGRFAQQLLQQAGLQWHLPGESSPQDKLIFGKECQQPKAVTLRQLLAQFAPKTPKVWFIEDRLKTLESVAQQPDLSAVELFLADWGYNTAPMRETAAQHPRIQLLSLTQLREQFML